MQTCIHENYRIQQKFWYLPLKIFRPEVLRDANHDEMLLNHNIRYLLLQKLKNSKTIK